MIDRTSDFLQILQKSQPLPTPTSSSSLPLSSSTNTSLTSPSPPSSKPDSRTAALSTLSKFHSQAGAISSSISHASGKLQILTKLVQKKSLFADPAVQINDLVVSIKDDISNLNNSLVQAQTFLNLSRQTLDLNSKNITTTSTSTALPVPEDARSTMHTQVVMLQLKNEVLEATSKFKDVLTVRSKNITDVGLRRLEFGADSSSGNGSGSGSGNGNGSRNGKSPDNRPSFMNSNNNSNSNQHRPSRPELFGNGNSNGNDSPSKQSSSSLSSSSQQLSAGGGGLNFGSPLRLAPPKPPPTSSAYDTSTPSNIGLYSRGASVSSNKNPSLSPSGPKGLPRPNGMDVFGGGSDSRYNNNNNNNNNGSSSGGGYGGGNYDKELSTPRDFTDNSDGADYGSGSGGSYYGGGSGNTNTLTPWELQQLELESGTTLTPETAHLLSGQSQSAPQVSTYLTDRANAVTQIESHISELGSVFQKLAGMIGEHGELVQRVEDDVEEATTNVEEGMLALTNTLHDLKNNKMLVVKIMGILMAFIIFFITFLA